MGSYKVHIYSRSVPYLNHRSAQPQFGEVESRSNPDAQLCTHNYPFNNNIQKSKVRKKKQYIQKQREQTGAYLRTKGAQAYKRQSQVQTIEVQVRQAETRETHN